jgi:IclR family pca regulon transcriptional regulator
MKNPTAKGPKEDLIGSMNGDRETIAGLARGLAVIRAFSAGGPLCTLTEIANITGLSPAAARRCLHTLEALGYAGRDGRKFFLRPRVLDLSSAYLDSVDSEGLAREYLQDIVKASGHSSSLAVLDGGEILYIARIGARRIVRLEASIGTRYPAYPTSLGRVLLAGLPPREISEYLTNTKLERLTRRTVVEREKLAELIRRTGEDGYSIVEDELAIGVTALAVPVYDGAGRVVAAINCSAQTGELNEKGLDPFIPLMREVAARISRALPHFPGLTLGST